MDNKERELHAKIIWNAPHVVGSFMEHDTDDCDICGSNWKTVVLSLQVARYVIILAETKNEVNHTEYDR